MHARKSVATSGSIRHFVILLVKFVISCMPARAKPGVEPAMASKPCAPGPLDGLSKDWEEDAVVRRRILWDGYLLCYPKPELTGVASYEAAAMNAEVLRPFFKRWCSSNSSPKTCHLKFVKKEVRLANCDAFSMGACMHACMYTNPEANPTICPC